MKETVAAIRRAVKRPAFTLIALTTLAVGIGSATATFSVADAILRQPLPVEDDSRIAVVWGQDQAVRSRRVPLPYGSFASFVNAGPRTLTQVAGVNYHGAVTNPVRDGAGGVNLKIAYVTGNLFHVLGVRPLMGRTLEPRDDDAGAAPVAAISYALWQRRFGGDPSVLGRVLTFRGRAATIVGVMPRGFAFPAQSEVWATVRPFNQVAVTGPPTFYVHLVGRLAPEATVEQSAQEVTQYLRNNAYGLPSTLRAMTATAQPYSEYLLGDVRPTITLLFAASGLVMAVAVVNVGALFLGLGLSRRQELAVRLSLGATPRRLLEQAAIDAGLVSATGAALGVLVAYAIVQLIVAFASEQLPRADAVAVNVVALLFAAALTIGSTVAFAASFVYGQRRTELSQWLLMAPRVGTATRAARRAQRGLVVVQVAVAMAVVVGAALMLRSQANLEQLGWGFAADRP